MVGFSKTLNRYRVGEWHTMYIDYEQLKTLVTEQKRIRELEAPAGTTSADDDYRGRDSVDETQWNRYANAPTLTTELVEIEKTPGEREALETLWDALGMDYEPMLAVKSALQDNGNGVAEVLVRFYQALDVQANRCNSFYETLVEMQAKALATALKRVEVIDASLNVATPVVSPRESEAEDDQGGETEIKPVRAGGRHSRHGSLSTTSGTDLHALFSKYKEKDKITDSSEAAAKRAAQALVDTNTSSSTAKSRETTVKALLHDIKEIYYSVCMIQNFSTLNAVAIRKITKKMDKEAGTRTSGIYCTTCDELAFWPDLKESTFQCKTMAKLCEEAFLTCHALIRRIEATKTGLVRFNTRTQSFATLRRKERVELLEKLRSTGNRIKDDGTKVNLDRDSPDNPILYFTGGFFWGIAFPALLIPLWYLVVSCGLQSTDDRCRRELAAFVTLRGAMLVFGQSLLWGPTVYVWQKLMVHWELIFFRSAGKTGLRAEYAIIATVLPWICFVIILTTSTVLWSSGNANTQWVKPLTMVLFIAFAVPVPASWEWADNPRYWFIQPPMTTRRFIGRHVMRIMSTPWTNVVFPDFFIADQLTSQSTAIADLMITFHLASETASTRVIAATIPHYWRFIQSFRRARDSVVHKRGGALSTHLLNAGKYGCSIVAIWLRFWALRSSQSDNHSSPPWIVAYIATASSVCYSLYWDFFMDWSIFTFNPESKWRVEFLSRRSLVKSRAVWVAAIVFNVFARSAGLFAAVPGLPMRHLSTQVLVTGLSAVEVIRRAIWNVFRVEAEHAVNCGGFRASADSQFDALEDPFVAHVDELSRELQYVPVKGGQKV